MGLKPTLLLIIVLACFSAGASVAQDKADQAKDAAKRAAPQASFASLDDDRDGAITRTEASERTQLLVDFERIDLDRDDKLEPAEYASFYAAGYRASK
jgi:Ni/Co efflux regulator RcnB